MVQPVDRDILAKLVRHGSASADPLAMQRYLTGDDRTRAVVGRALGMFAAPARVDADRLDAVHDLGAVAGRTAPDGTVTTGADSPARGV